MTEGAFSLWPAISISLGRLLFSVTVDYEVAAIIAWADSQSQRHFPSS